MLERHHRVDARISRNARRVRRRIVRGGVLLRANAFCIRKGISCQKLLRLLRKREVFSMTVDGVPHYPAALAGGRIQGRRISKLLRRMPVVLPSELLFDLLHTRRASLGNKSPLQTIRRRKQFRIALRVADCLADEFCKAHRVVRMRVKFANMQALRNGRA